MGFGEEQLRGEELIPVEMRAFISLTRLLAKRNNIQSGVESRVQRHRSTHPFAFSLERLVNQNPEVLRLDSPKEFIYFLP